MSFTVAAVATVAVSAYVSYENGKKQADAQKQAAEQSKAAADKQAAQADQAFNKANQKQPDTSYLLAAAQQAGKSGPSGTMLTGVSGIDPSQLALGKSALLGQ